MSGSVQDSPSYQLAILEMCGEFAGKEKVPAIPRAGGLWLQMSRVTRKPTFCICENKDADQLRGNREADQRLCFRYTDSTIPLLP